MNPRIIMMIMAMNLPRTIMIIVSVIQYHGALPGSRRITCCLFNELSNENLQYSRRFLFVVNATILGCHEPVTTAMPTDIRAWGEWLFAQIKDKTKEQWGEMDMRISNRVSKHLRMPSSPLSSRIGNGLIIRLRSMIIGTSTLGLGYYLRHVS